MARSHISRLLWTGQTILVFVGAANAGAFDRGGVNIELLFDEAGRAAEVGATYVSPSRKLENVRRLDTGVTTATIDLEDDYIVPRIGLKARFEDIDCLATYTEPYGADVNYGINNAYSPTAVEFQIDTHDYGLTCSYKFNVGTFQDSPSFVRIIGGVSYQQLDAFQSRQTLQILGNSGLGIFDLSDETTSWRIGTSFEIPDKEFRASLVYSAEYDYGDLAGTVDTTGFAAGPTGPSRGAFLGVFPVTASAEVPQAIDLRFRSGIRDDLPWLVLGSIRWQDWSKLQIIPINGVVNPVTGAISTTTSFDPLFRDGWTVSAAIGRNFISENLFGAFSVSWDRGTSTSSGYYSDLWSVGARATYSTAMIDLNLGGSIGIWQAGDSIFTQGDPSNRIAYSFGDDPVVSVLGSIKIKF